VDKPIFMLLTLWAQMQAKLEDRSRGQGFVEYAFIMIFVSVGLVLALTAFKDGLSSMFTYLKGCLDGTC
jgi:Flp pilus assembly pilin Flp